MGRKSMKPPRKHKRVFIMPNGVTVALSAKRIAKICKGCWKIYKKILHSI
jgi:hypothetical protein